MNFSKKIAMIAMAAVLALSLVACGTSTTSTPATPSESTPPTDTSPAGTPQESTPKPSADALAVDVFIYDFSDPYIGSVRDYMDSGFKAAGLNATFHDGASDQGKQIEQIETALTKGTGLLIVNIVTTGSEEAAMNIVEMAKGKDVSLLFFNREVSDAVVNSYDKCAFVGTDADEAGYMQGEMIFDILNAGFDKYDLNGDGAISYIMFKGELGNAEADGRTTYSVEEANRLLVAAGKNPLKYYDPSNTDLFQPCNWSSAEAQGVMATALSTSPFSGDNPIELVIANNDEMALGAIEALNEAGYNKGSGDFIPVVGVDATAPAQDAIKAGKMSGTIKQDAEGMANCIVALSSNIAGGGNLLDNASGYNIDSGVNKIRIPYAKYTG